ncbi:MAG: hypothetical protein ABIQ64_01760 [Candidatus Saccharimonadales bacterium]
MQPQFISPVANRKQSRSKLPIIAAIVGVLVVIGGGIAILVISNSNNPVPDMDRLNTRMNAVSSYVAEGRKSARSADVVKITSDASILLTGDTATLKKVTSTAGAQGKSKDVIASEKRRGDAILKDLKSASVDGRFDREYVSTLKEELSDTQDLLLKVNEASSKAAVKTATMNVNDHIDTILVALGKLSL